MSATLSNLKPWRPGQSGNPSGYTRERAALHAAIERSEIPKVLTMLAALYERGLEGDVAAARLWLDQVRGPAKARDSDEIERAVEQRILELISEARARKIAGNAGTYGQAAMGQSDRHRPEDDRE